MVLIACGAGTIDAGIAGTLLENNITKAVIAAPGLVRTIDVPDMLRRFIGAHETLDLAFNRRLPYRAISK